MLKEEKIKRIQELNRKMAEAMVYFEKSQKQ
jgi:hypothetical protein